MVCIGVDTRAHPGHVCAATWEQVRELLPAGEARLYEVALLVVVSTAVLALGLSAVVALMAWRAWMREELERRRERQERAAALAARSRRSRGPRVYPVVCPSDATVVWRRPSAGERGGDEEDPDGRE